MNADQRWALAVLELDGWTCQNCGSNTCLDAAHIEPKSRRPDLALDPANGITLCRFCHRYFHDHPYEFTLFTYGFQRHHVSRFSSAHETAAEPIS